jgi:hypothetical protein
MSTTTAPQHHFPHSVALAAVSAVVVAGGLAAIGVAAFQDDATAPSQSKVSTTTHNQQCPDPRCMPSAPSQPSGGHPGVTAQPVLKGGTIMIGQP